MSIVYHFLNWLSKLFKALWLFFAGVVSVVAIYYLLTGVEQGIDVVIQSGELLDSGVLSVLAVFLWAFLVWYSCRMLSYIKQNKDDEIFSKKTPGDYSSAMLYHRYCIPSALYQHIPRILAYNCFVSVQVAIFHLPTFFGWEGAFMFAVIFLHNVFYFVLHAWFNGSGSPTMRRWIAVIAPFVIAAYVTFILSSIIKNSNVNLVSDPLRHMFWLGLIALAMFLLQITIIFLFILRRRSIDARRKDPDLVASPTLRWLGVQSRI